MSFLWYDYEQRVTTNTFEQFLITNIFHDAPAYYSLDELIAKCQPLIFDFTYPFYNDSAGDKSNFEQQFIRHYWQQDIGLETMGQFKYYLQSRLIDVMPYYHDLYATQHLDYDPLSNRKITRNSKLTIDDLENTNENVNISGDSNNNNNTTTNGQSIHSDAPQINFSGADYASSMDRDQNTGNNSSTTNSSSNSTRNHNVTRDNEHTEDTTEEGFAGASYQELIRQERDLIININLELINECSDLFYGLL